MTDHKRESKKTESEARALKAALIRLEDKLMDIACEANSIKEMFGVSFADLHPWWTSRKKPGLHVHCGIEAVAEALGKDIEIKKDFGREQANVHHRKCEYMQLPDYDVPRYAAAWEDNPESRPLQITQSNGAAKKQRERWEA